MAGNNGLPQGWVWTTIGEACKTTSGGTPSRKVPSYYGGEIPWLKSGELEDSLIHSTEESITDGGLKNSSAKVFPKGTLLIALYGATVGRLGILGIDAATNQAICALYPPENLDNKYLFWFLRRHREELLKARIGGAQPNISQSILREVALPLPPRSEQERIVARIEELFTQLEAGVAELQNAKAQLKRYRAAVLKSAVEGELTREWREAHQGEKEPTHPDIGALRDLPDGWVWTTMDKVVESLDHKRIPINKKERANRIGDIPYYGANGQVGWIDDYIFDEPLVLVVEDETFIGRTKPFCYKITGKSWVNNHAHVLRPKSAVSVDFLNYSLQYYPFTPLTTGTTGRRKLTKSALMKAPYSLPPRSEQERIVEKIERRLSVADKIEKELDESLVRAERLRGSVLKAAFEGRLV